MSNRKSGIKRDGAGDSLGVDAVIEDVFGLNLRGLRTIWAMFIHPHRVFSAARDEKWRGLFTPSIRLAFFLVTLSVVTRYIWAYEGSYFYETTARGFAATQSGQSGAMTREDIKSLIETSLIAFPFIYIIVSALTASITGFGGRVLG